MTAGQKRLQRTAEARMGGGGLGGEVGFEESGQKGVSLKMGQRRKKGH